MRFEEEMLKSAEEWGLECERGQHVRAYCDPVLARSRTEYKGFVLRLHEAGLVRLGSKSQVIVTPFCVYR